jgi:acyl-CoA dehydrogenase
MDFRLSEEEKDIQLKVRAFVKQYLIPMEADLLNANPEIYRLEKEELLNLQIKAKELGLWGLTTPKQYGGKNYGTVINSLINMELSKTFVPFKFGGSADNILYKCTEAQKRKYLLPVINGEKRSCFALTEPEAGSDLSNISTTAKEAEDHWVLNGTKIFITHADAADFAIVFALTENKEGINKGVTAFLVDKDSGWILNKIDTMGPRKTNELIFKNVKIPKENVLGGIGKGFEIGIEWIVQARLTVASRAIGAGEHLLNMAIDRAKKRVTFSKPLADRQSIQWMIADSAVELQAAKWLTLHTAWLDDNNYDARHNASMSKLFSSNIANKVVDRVLQIHGGLGYTKMLPIERWYREMRLWRIFEGTDEIHRFIISRNLLRGNVNIEETY